MTDKLKENIISLAYGRASLAAKLNACMAIYKNAEAKELYNEHKKIALAIKKLGNEECPAEVIKNAAEAIKIRKEINKALPLTNRIFFTRTLYSATAVALIAVSVIFLYDGNKSGRKEYHQQQAAGEAALQTQAKTAQQSQLTKTIEPKRTEPAEQMPAEPARQQQHEEQTDRKQQGELVEQQTERALAIVGRVLNHSKEQLTDEVLYKQVSKPLRAGIETMNLLFK